MPAMLMAQAGSMQVHVLLCLIGTGHPRCRGRARRARL